MKKLYIIPLLFVVFLTMSGCKKYESTDITKYREFASSEKYVGERTLFTIFPDQIPDSAEIEQYYFYYKEDLFDNSYQIFLNCTLGSEDYEKEKERVSSLVDPGLIDPSEVRKKIRYDDKNFIYPAYVAKLGHDSTNEYVLFDDSESRVVYVYLQFIEPREIQFPAKYLPDGYSGWGDCSDSYVVFGY